MKLQGFNMAAGACKKIPERSLPWEANLEGSPAANRHVEAMTTGSPKPMM